MNRMKQELAVPIRQNGYPVDAKKLFERSELEQKGRIGNRVGTGPGAAVRMAEGK